MMRNLLLAGALAAAAGVTLGAFGAHALRDRLEPGLLDAWQTAVQYHLVHALAMVALGLAGNHLSNSLFAWSGWLLFAGIVLFSGSLYLVALTGTRWPGAITPLGGIAFIAGWIVLAWAAWKMPAAG